MNNEFYLSKLSWMLMHQHGIIVPDYNNLQTLSDNLLSQKNIHLSVNTLARITGLKNESRNHYNHTLDSLAIATGFGSYEHYMSIFRFKKESYLSNTSWSGADFIFSYAEKAAQKNDSAYIISLSDFIIEHGCSVDVMLKLGYALTKGLRVNSTPEKIIPVLVEIPIYIDLLFETYVDIDHLAGYFGRAMLLLSDQSFMGSRSWLFSTTLSWHYSKLISNNDDYLKKGMQLLDFADEHAHTLIKNNLIYPYARLISAAILFAIEQNYSDKSSKLFDKMISTIENLQPDYAMVIISQVSDLAPQLNTSEWEKLIFIFKKIFKSIQFERDSLFNAAVNLSSINNKWLINPYEIKAELERNPLQFFSCMYTLKNKHANAFKKII